MKTLAWLLCLAMLGCQSFAEHTDPDDNEHDDDRGAMQAELDLMVEDGLDDGQQPVFVAGERELLEHTLTHRQYGERYTARARTAVAPIALLMGFFAVEGPADLILAIAPVDKIKDVKRCIESGRKARKNAKALARAKEQLQALIDEDVDDLAVLARKLSKMNVRGLMTIRKETKSVQVTRKLMALALKNEANVDWIGKKLKRGQLDPTFVRRLTFDGDLVAEYSLHSASPSWRTLEQIASSCKMDCGKRTSLAIKVTGLLGERAAADMIRRPTFYRRYFPGDNVPPSLARGMGYGGNRSIDIVAYGNGGKALYAEVKNWSIASWTESGRKKIIEQLKNHDNGILLLMRESPTRHAVAGKVLMVQKEGFEQMDGRVISKFEGQLKRIEWTLEKIPSSEIANFGDLIRSVQ